MKGKELKEFREKIGFTQEQLADALSVASNTISRWERDDRAIPPYLHLALRTIERDNDTKANTNTMSQKKRK